VKGLLKFFVNCEPVFYGMMAVVLFYCVLCGLF
jgi:hypothetical protein